MNPTKTEPFFGPNTTGQSRRYIWGCNLVDPYSTWGTNITEYLELISSECKAGSNNDKDLIWIVIGIVGVVILSLMMGISVVKCRTKSKKNDKYHAVQ